MSGGASGSNHQPAHGADPAHHIQQPYFSHYNASASKNNSPAPFVYSEQSQNDSTGSVMASHSLANQNYPVLQSMDSSVSNPGLRPTIDEFDYFSQASSVSVPGSRIDHLYSSQSEDLFIQQNQFGAIPQFQQPPTGLSGNNPDNVNGVKIEGHQKRKLSFGGNTSLAVPHSSMKYPPKPKPIRQSSFPVSGNDRRHLQQQQQNHHHHHQHQSSNLAQQNSFQNIHQHYQQNLQSIQGNTTSAGSTPTTTNGGQNEIPIDNFDNFFGLNEQLSFFASSDNSNTNNSQNALSSPYSNDQYTQVATGATANPNLDTGNTKQLEFSNISPKPVQFVKQEGVEISKKTKVAPKPRGRPRKSKNPGFFLKLDNISNHSNGSSVHKNSNTISSSHSDSVAYNWNRPSNVDRAGTRLFSANNIPLFQDDERVTPNPDLNILEQDLGFYDDPGHRFTPTNSSITPSMKPPGSNVNGYFELGDHLTNAGHLNGGSSANSLINHYVSPHINYRENSYNNFNKEFEDYITDSKQESLEGSAAFFSDVDTTPKSNTNQNLTNRFNDVSGLSGSAIGRENNNGELHVDLGGFNFDVNPRDDSLDGQDLFKPAQFTKLEVDDSVTASLLVPAPIYTDGGGEPRPSSVDFSGGSTHSQEFASLEQDGEFENHLTIPRPSMERSSSNNSMSSGNSTGSNQGEAEVVQSSSTVKSKKKRAPKGAVCTICDKYISRDLTRHMRIHNEVGRFQCVYPKFMCNHKTQYFNRPYDYKKHLLHMHFKFDDPKGKTANTLTDKLPMEGSCIACGARFKANDWLEDHVLSNNPKTKCPCVENRSSKE